MLSLFEKDIGTLMMRLREDAEGEVSKGLDKLADRLVQLRDENLLKINHSVMEMVVAKHLLKRGYRVDLEKEVDGDLTCDVLAVKGEGKLIVEVETGYVPPSHALDPVDYIRARISSKISRYSNYCHKFVLASPPHYIMPIPEVFVRPPRFRKKEQLKTIKEYCDIYYSNPPVTLEEILRSRIHSVFLVEVDRLSVIENAPTEYMNKIKGWYP